ncbi:hypothetical protein KFL_004860130 [Klebsormidium nitens]|uniref:Uncharacterized protein n=1 Tax=Klebsormidium nitens TaxID=105231 RepID=A0A1Y1IDQ6_KLENI|nr:hypothetical protein KFL_004860130 [Klebsormidium nitens]|eukprot:GAQ89095.1 hypothetical protein KFL_004860130 [Klebsormidium nitens]
MVKRLEKAREQREAGLLLKLTNTELKLELKAKEADLFELEATHAAHDLELLKQAKQEAVDQIEKLVHENRLSRAREAYAKDKNSELRTEVEEKTHQLDEALKKHKQDLENLLKGTNVNTKRGRIFTDSVRTVYYKLIALNVPTNRIHEIIRAILGEFAPDVKLGNLPSRTTASHFRKECVGLAYQQTADILGGSGAHKYQTLNVDEASKQKKGFLATVQTTIIDGQRKSFVLGLKRTFHKTAVGALGNFEKLLEDIQLVNSRRLGPGETLRLIVNILEYTVNSQTDRGASVLKFVTELFPKFRATFLANYKEGWADLTPEQQKRLSTIVAHDCNNHFWHNVGVAALKGLHDFENTYFAEAAAAVRGKGHACAAEAAVWAAMKDFSWRASEQSGFGAQVLIEWLEQMTDKHFEDADFKAQLGNRFNVVYENAGGLYHLLDGILGFYEESSSTSAATGGYFNLLHVAVAAQLSDPVIQAQLRVMGLINAQIFHPWFKRIHQHGNILALNALYKKQREDLAALVEDPSHFMDGSYQALPDLPTTRDKIFESLIAPSANDAMVKDMLVYSLGAVLAYLQVVKEQYLPGGDLWEPDEETFRMAESVPLHTDRVEGVFAQVESILRRSPRMSMLTAEGQVLVTANKTIAWLVKQADKADIITAARKSVSGLEKSAKDQETEGREDRQAERARVLALAAQKLLAEQVERARLCDALEELRWWKTADDIDAGLARVEVKLREESPDLHGRSFDAALRGEKKDALIVQLQGLQKIRKLGAPAGNPSAFQKSKGGKDFTVDELIANLLSVLTSGRQPAPAVGELDENGDEVLPPGRRTVRPVEQQQLLRERDAETRRVAILSAQERRALEDEAKAKELEKKEAEKRAAAEARAETLRLKTEAATLAKEKRAAERAAAKEERLRQRRGLGAQTGQGMLEADANLEEQPGGSPEHEQEERAGAEEQPGGSPEREQDEGAGAEEQLGGSPEREQNEGAGAEEQPGGSPEREQDEGAGAEEQPGGSPEREQDEGAGAEEQHGQYEGADAKEQPGGSPEHGAHVSAGAEKQPGGSPEQSQNLVGCTAQEQRGGEAEHGQVDRAEGGGEHNQGEVVRAPDEQATWESSVLGGVVVGRRKRRSNQKRRPRKVLLGSPNAEAVTIGKRKRAPTRDAMFDYNEH